MRHESPIIFLLWGRHFDEIDAVIFVSELRTAGLCVKVVGLEGRPTAGAYGLVITPDLALGQLSSLAQQAIAIVLPCSLDRMLHYAHDPRLVYFLQEAQRRQVCFIVRHSELIAAEDQLWARTLQLVWPFVPLIAYPGYQELFTFVHILATHVRLGKPLGA